MSVMSPTPTSNGASSRSRPPARADRNHHPAPASSRLVRSNVPGATLENSKVQSSRTVLGRPQLDPHDRRIVGRFGFRAVEDDTPRYPDPRPQNQRHAPCIAGGDVDGGKGKLLDALAICGSRTGAGAGSIRTARPASSVD